MVPFSLSLRSKRSKSARPRTPSSPASFATPRSPRWFVPPSRPQEQLLLDINTPRGDKTLVLLHEDSSVAATSPPQPAEQEKIQAIAVPRPSTTTGVRRPSLSSVTPPSLTHRRAESQGLSSNVHASVRRGPPPPIQIRSMHDMSISPNRKASRLKGEAGRFDTKDLPPVPDRKAQSNFPEGPSVAEPHDTSWLDKSVLPDRSNSTTTRQISGNRGKKNPQKPHGDVPEGMLLREPHSDFGHERSATEATIIPTLPLPNGSEIVDSFTSSSPQTLHPMSLPTLLSSTMQGPSTIPVAPGLQPQTVSSLTDALPPVERTSRSGASASLPSKVDTNLGPGVVAGVPPPSPGPRTNNPNSYYQPQDGDLLFSPNFILADEGGHTPGLFPEDYSVRTSSQLVSELGQEDAEFLSTTHAALDLHSPLMIAETMARQDSATLPAEGDGNPPLDSLGPPLGDGPGDDHRKGIFRRPHEVQFHPKSPNVSGELFPSVFAAGASGNNPSNPPEVLRWRSRRLDSNDVDGRSLGARFSQQRSVKRHGSLPTSTEGVPSHARSSTLSSLDRFRRSVSAALITASISRNNNRSSDITPVGGSTSPGGNRNIPDRLLDSAKRFVSGSGSSKPQGVDQQPPGRHEPHSHDVPGDVKGKGHTDTSASISGALAVISALDPDRRGSVKGSTNSSPNSASPSYTPAITHTPSTSQSHGQRLNRQQPQQLGQSPASATSSNTFSTPSSYSPLAAFSRPTPHSPTFTTPPSADNTCPLRFIGESEVPSSSFDHIYSGPDHLGPRVRSASEGSTTIGSSPISNSTPSFTVLHDTAQYQYPRLDMNISTRPSIESPRNHARTLTSISLSDLNFRYNLSEIGADSAPLLPGTPFPSKVRYKWSHPTILRLAPAKVPPASSPQPDAATLQTQTPSTVVAVSGSSPHPGESPGVMLPQEPEESFVSMTPLPGSISSSGGGLRPVTPTSRLHFKPSDPIGPRTRPVPPLIICAGSYDIKHPTIIDSPNQKKISQSSDPIVAQLSTVSPFAPNLSHTSPVAHACIPPRNRERPSSSFGEARRTPSSPIFDTVPIQWKGLTMEQAKWIFTKAELQSLAASAIRQSAETTSIRLLHQHVLDVELPEEIERLETLRDEIKAKYQHQARLRQLLTRSLALHIDGSDTDAACRLLAEITEVSALCEMLSTDLFVVIDQLAQISHLRDTHMSSALTMALHKLNAAFLRTSAETEDLREIISLMEADRDEGWAKALELEHALDEARRQLAEVAIDKSTTMPPRGTRVSAARKSSLSKANFRSSSRRSARLSSHSMKMANLVFPHPPSAFHCDVSPPISTPGVHTAPVPGNRFRPESVISRMTSTGVSTPSSSMRAMVSAQNEVLELLGLSLIDLDKSPSSANSQRPRPHSLSSLPPNTIVAAPDSPTPTRPASLQVPYSPYSLHTLSPYLRRRSTSIPDATSLPHRVTSLPPGDPDAIFRAMVSRATP